MPKKHTTKFDTAKKKKIINQKNKKMKLTNKITKKNKNTPKEKNET